MLVWVASYPRSGNTLAMLVLRDVFGVGRLGAVYGGKQIVWHFIRDPGLIPPQTGSAEWKPPEEFAGLGSEPLLDAVRARPEPYFIKTHRIAMATDPAPALYLVRDGRDAVVSQAHFVADRDRPEFKELSFNRRLARLTHPGIRAQGPWSRHVRVWRGRAAPTALVRFERLIADPAVELARACAQIEVPLGEPAGRLRTFDDLHARHPTLFRRGTTAGWKDEMAPHLQERFWRCHGAEMEALGYPHH